MKTARSRNPYLRALSSPGALRFSVAGFLGRFPASMYGLGGALLVLAHGGGYGLAGTVAGAHAAGYAVSSPQTARLADRLGQHRVLYPLALISAIATTLLITCAEVGAPAWTLVAFSGMAGVAQPSLGSMVRTRWSVLLGDTPLLHTAFSLESVVDEVIFVVGPVLVTLLATQVYPASGVAVAAVLCVSGILLLAAQRGTEPPPSPHRPGAGRRFRMGLPARGLVTLAPVYLFFGGMLAAIDLATVEFSDEHGHKSLAGFILGAYALGSAAGGLWYGSRTWHSTLRRRFAIALGAAAAGTATFWAMPGLVTLSVAIFIGGIALAPMLIAGFSLVDQQALAGRKTEGMALLTSSIAVGIAVGSTASGKIIDAAGPRWGYAFAAACAAGALLVCLAGLSRLTIPAR